MFNGGDGGENSRPRYEVAMSGTLYRPIQNEKDQPLRFAEPLRLGYLLQVPTL